MTAIPRYRAWSGPALLSAGFRPFFLASGVWAALALPLWIALYAGAANLPTLLLPTVWHAHEMVFGFAVATVSGFMLTAVPNWTGRMPLQGLPLAGLVLLWVCGRAGVLLSAKIGPGVAAALDLAFPAVFLVVIAREIVAGHNWRNLPLIGALSSLLLGNALVHAEALGLAETAMVGNRLGIATLLMLISFVGGRIVPSFTRNWLAKNRPELPAPVPFTGFDRAVLALTFVTLALWVAAPDNPIEPGLCLAAGLAHATRLARWQGLPSRTEPLLWVLHLGYAWLAFGLFFLGLDDVVPWLPQTTALHALTVGAIGTMTLAVMTRATLGHTGRALTAGPGTTVIYVLVSLAAIGRLLAPLSGAQYLTMLSVSAACWSGAFGLFVVLYLPALAFARPGRAASHVAPA